MKKIKPEDFDRLFDDGKEDITEYLDYSTFERVGARPQRVNIDLQPWMVNSLDREANRIGITRQALIKKWLDEKLEHASHASR